MVRKGAGLWKSEWLAGSTTTSVAWAPPTATLFAEASETRGTAGILAVNGM